MNERIRELAEQATTYIDPIANDGLCWDFDKEKFAQLIVQECKKIITIEHTALDLPEYNLGILEGYRRARESMSIHFGVRE